MPRRCWLWLEAPRGPGERVLRTATPGCAASTPLRRPLPNRRNRRLVCGPSFGCSDRKAEMDSGRYDAIVVGARCAGSPTAMLLARKGYRVLLVDRATFPSDTMSTHIVHPPGAAALKRWGLLDRLAATGCPPIDTYSFDFGAVTVSGAPGTADSPVGYSPRRIVLDKILVDAAAEAGAEVREGFTVEEVISENGQVVGVRGHESGGGSVTESARVVVGADGLH